MKKFVFIVSLALVAVACAKKDEAVAPVVAPAAEAPAAAPAVAATPATAAPEAAEKASISPENPPAQ